MTARFRLTKPALKDIEQIADYIARTGGVAQADLFLDELNQKLVKVAQFPKLGRQRDEILPSVRSLSLKTYLILYLPTQNGIDILRVVSGYRDLTHLFEN
ncbi:type II toxin-antitoxin system RelE/ParE family toxin [Picosynechococcus sp. PCC 7117]|uniref:type II toxin-antitoxin system RelE/ParE family toxin n=1 Tax=Picosynechococcus sp. PCC 7117 TaxID=195498 RepID=UPI0008107049|nr:type II toxin-antitoxin system RelE/ParE family toxin [Picosynechococcus sp. PCC 7117]ANV88308.1 plasmid stabilization protein [Picosynechococcus sp. PCC 7117]